MMVPYNANDIALIAIGIFAWISSTAWLFYFLYYLFY